MPPCVRLFLLDFCAVLHKDRHLMNKHDSLILMEVVSGGETLCLTVLSGGHTLSHLFSLCVCVCVCVCVSCCISV